MKIVCRHIFLEKSKFTLKERISMCKDYLEMGLSHKDILIKYSVSIHFILLYKFYQQIKINY